MEWRRYVPVAERRAKARREMNKLHKKGRDFQPIEIEGRTIAWSFWGKRWCEHLESFSDYANRLPRGRTYVRNGSVCHLAIRTGRIDAIVSGSELYDVTIRIDKLKAAVWKSVRRRCSGQIGSMLELLQGKLSQQVMSVVTDRERGLFPKPGEIKFDCSCPDWATMCKHVASVLYGVGGRLDDRPESLFLLRGVDTAELIATEMTLPGDAATDDALADDALAGLFGIDLDTGIDTGDAQSPAAKAPAKPRKQARRHAAPAPERQAPPVAKTRERSVSTVSRGVPARQPRAPRAARKCLQPPRPENRLRRRPGISLLPRRPRDAPARRPRAPLVARHLLQPPSRGNVSPQRFGMLPPPRPPPHPATSDPPGSGWPGCAGGAASPSPDSPDSSAYR